MLFGLQTLVAAFLIAKRPRGAAIRRARPISASNENVSVKEQSSSGGSHTCGLDSLTYDPSVYKAGADAQRRVGFTGGSILVDVENLRGKSGFGLSHKEIQHSMTIWSQLCQLEGQVSLVVDHGNEESAYYLAEASVTIVFAGPSRKADDVIAHDLSFLGQETDVLVVTADRGLIDRCRRSAVRRNMSIMSPLTLLEDLEQILEKVPLPLASEPGNDPTGNDESQVSSDPSAMELKPKIEALEHEIKLGAELLEAEALLRTKSGVNNKRKGKLKAKVRSLREKLNRSKSLLTEVVEDVLRSGPNHALSGRMTGEEQSALLARWDKVRRSSNRKEKTGDRVILAENWRRELQAHHDNLESFGDEAESTPPRPSNIAMAHFMKYAPLKQDVKLPKSNSLRLVVISDTHGFEESLTSSLDGSTLPDGDVLVHLGDFAVDGSQKNEALKKFDSWLSKQPHPIKLIVRGNHDPRTWYPSQSGATFITKPTTMTIGEFVFAFVPYLAQGKVSNRDMPRRCDVICTHVPPRDLLDRCYSGKHAGSDTLRRGVQRMASKSRSPPILWLCGHIHEARGAIRHNFSTSSSLETLVVNAAQANAGLAKRIEHGPVVLQLEMDANNKKQKQVQVLDFDNRYLFLNKQDATFFQDNPKQDTAKKLLLAVDLGLRTGFSLFDESGRLLCYEQQLFENMDDLRSGALEFMTEWEDRLSSLDPGTGGRISHLAVEGADVALRGVWTEICDERTDQQLLFVRPEEWRADLLSAKEKSSGASSKEAARLIARQIVADCSGTLHEGKFQTDVAESVLVGYHVARRLGWIQREPAVRRYSNGKVVVPKANTPSTMQHIGSSRTIDALV